MIYALLYYLSVAFYKMHFIEAVLDSIKRMENLSDKLSAKQKLLCNRSERKVCRF